MLRSVSLALLLCFHPLAAYAQAADGRHAALSFAVLESVQRQIATGSVESRWPRGVSLAVDVRAVGRLRGSVELLAVSESQKRTSSVARSSTQSALAGFQVDLLRRPRGRVFVEGQGGVARLHASYGDDGDTQFAAAYELSAGAELFLSSKFGLRARTGSRRTNHVNQTKAAVGVVARF